MTTAQQIKMACSKCGAQMEAGFIADVGHGNMVQQPHWVTGEPEKSFWRGLKTSGRAVLKISTFRCAGCGYLESYAAELNNEKD